MFFNYINFDRTILLIITSWAIIYLIILNIAETYVEVVNYRHIVPIFSYLIILYFSLIILIKYYLNKFNYYRLSRLLVVISFIVFIPSFFFSSKNLMQSTMYNFKNGMNSEYQSSIIEYLKSYNLNRSIQIFSNDSWKISFYKIQNLSPLQKKSYSISSFYLIWNNKSKLNSENILWRIDEKFKPDTIKRFDDGLFILYKKRE